MKRVVFEFDERSEIKLDKLREMGFTFVECGDVILPKLGIKGLRRVDPADLAEYEREMDKVVPQIVEDMNRRAAWADEARTRRMA